MQINVCPCLMTLLLLVMLLTRDANAAGTRSTSEFVSVQGSLLYESAKEGHVMCAKALLAYGASTSFHYGVSFQCKVYTRN